MAQRDDLSSLERIAAAFSGQPHDRVPIIEFVIDPHVARSLYPTARDVPEVMDLLGLDAVSAGPTWHRTPETGTEWLDEWGVRYRAGAQVLAHPIGGPIASADDLACYHPPDPDAPWRLDALRTVVARYKGRRSIWFHHRAAFMWSAYLAGLERVLEWMYTEPDLVHALFTRVADVNERIIRNAIRGGAEVIVLGDDYASNQAPLFSPTHFNQFVRPHLARMVAAIHDEGARVVKHTDGNIWPIIEAIVSTGIDGLNPLEPVAGMDLGQVKAEYGARVCLIGNIDCGELLSHGTIEEVEQAVRTALAAGMPGGCYMLSSSNSIHASVKPENYRAMVDAGKRWGKY
ncbi:MAG: uroporphyrinogen decarboxylase family protein [Anaerolineae bacterium]